MYLPPAIINRTCRNPSLRPLRGEPQVRFERGPSLGVRAFVHSAGGFVHLGHTDTSVYRNGRSRSAPPI